MPNFLTLDQLDVAERRVLVRVDLNVPMKDGRVSDATRLERAATTLAELADKRAKVVVMSHFGRPKGPDPKLSLAQLLEPLRRTLPSRHIAFAADCIGPVTEAAVAALKPGELGERHRGALQPRRVAHPPVLHRHVEVDAHQHAALGDVELVESEEIRHEGIRGIGVG